MFEVGFWELALIGVIALLVVGPERLPKMARTVGLWVGKARFFVAQVKEDIDREVRKEELKELLGKPSEFEDVYSMAEDTKGKLDEVRAAIASSQADMTTASEDVFNSIAPPAVVESESPAPAVASGPDEAPVVDESSPSAENDERRPESS